MSRKKIKVPVETFYTLTPDACKALGVEYDEERPTTMAEIVAAQEQLKEGNPQCTQSTETDKKENPNP
jgi:hypothetical protein